MHAVSISGLPRRALRPLTRPRHRATVANLLRHSNLLSEAQRTIGVEQATRHALTYFVVPLWLGAGLADWACHRATRIERTAGAHEAATHLLMLAEAGAPSVMGLFMEINAGMLLTSVTALIAHELTAAWDVAYAEPRRRVTPTEQHVHSFLEVVPLMAVSFLTALHWDQARALVGLGPQRPDFRLRMKRRPLPMPYIVGVLAAIGLFGVLPYAEELWRCYRVDHTLEPRPEPPLPATETLRIPETGLEEPVTTARS